MCPFEEDIWACVEADEKRSKIVTVIDNTSHMTRLRPKDHSQVKNRKIKEFRVHG